MDELAGGLPELPDAKKARFMSQYGLPAYDAGVLVMEQATADFYEVVARGRDGKVASNWMLGDFFAGLNRMGRGIRGQPGLGGGAGRACWTCWRMRRSTAASPRR